MISMIWAMSSNRVIGKDGDMPWHLPNDLKYFKKVTSGHPVLMGRTTFDSIGKALPKRRNIVLTRSDDFSAEGVEVIHSLDEVNGLAREEEEFFVIGGATVYEQLMPLAERLYVTEIHESFEGDTFFPAFDMEKWELVSTEEGEMDEKNPYPHTFKVYERKN
ncbi:MULTISPECIES: dihydrofolate reductase [Bacillaceae]|uniref:Dihydrofolate reductase n=1 Tax=Evansella alkalicola TaxID=745819 RepID=A0ABS6JUA1_9BACI|nr:MULTISPECIES: dihydrofolate reductase [Bacillaceae]MBU9722147.1 dihydrofolate reductase [Bacillus alkalicola]